MDRILNQFLKSFTIKERIMFFLYLMFFVVIFAEASYSAYIDTIHYQMSVWVALLVLAILFFSLGLIIIVHIILFD